MAQFLEELVIDRVDLVDEGANSVSDIVLFKRKEKLNIMNFEELMGTLDDKSKEIVKAKLEEVQKSKEDVISDLNSRIEDVSKELSDMKATKEEEDKKKAEECSKASFDEEEVLKAMPEAAREFYAKMKLQKETAEEALRKSNEDIANAAAIAKAATLKSLPIAQDRLVGILKSASEDVVTMLSELSAAFDSSVLDEVGKNKRGSEGTPNAWEQIETEAATIMKSRDLTKAQAITEVLKENPDLYKQYLEGGNT